MADFQRQTRLWADPFLDPFLLFPCSSLTWWRTRAKRPRLRPVATLSGEAWPVLVTLVLGFTNGERDRERGGENEREI